MKISAGAYFASSTSHWLKVTCKMRIIQFKCHHPNVLTTQKNPTLLSIPKNISKQYHNGAELGNQANCGIIHGRRGAGAAGCCSTNCCAPMRARRLVLSATPVSIGFNWIYFAFDRIIWLLDAFWVSFKVFDGIILVCIQLSGDHVALPVRRP